MKLLIKFYMSCRHLLEVMGSVNTKNWVLQVILAMGGLMWGNILGELMFPVYGVDWALNFNNFDMSRRSRLLKVMATYIRG